MADPVLVITGASSGIGAQTARRAAEAGYRMVLGARREQKLAELASELGGEERAVAVGGEGSSRSRPSSGARWC
jgi:NADP-dependent 3-hydroxy acid dehydrogenase YdfG